MGVKLTYFDLISPKPFYVENIGSIISPKLIEISNAGGLSVYQNYLSTILIDLKTYFKIIGKEQEFNQLSDEVKEQLNVFDLFLSSEELIESLQTALNFFIKEDVTYSKEHKSFLVIKREESNSIDNKIVGIISKENFSQVCDLICQRNFVKSKRLEEDFSKAKNKKALEIMKKLQKGREEKAKQTKPDKNMELGNIISAVANKSHSLNIINIWDLTVYQLWDCFARLSNNNIYDIQCMSVATWGDKENHFDATTWFKKIDDSN